MKRLTIVILIILVGWSASVWASDVLAITREIDEWIKLQKRMQKSEIAIPHPPSLTVMEINRYIRDAARTYQLPEKLLLALIRVESGYDGTNPINPSRIISRAGCIGLTQLHPATAEILHVDPYNVRENVFGGAKYFRFLYNKLHSVEDALWAYNAGIGNQRKGIFPLETRRYVDLVMQYWKKYEKGK